MALDDRYRTTPFAEAQEYLRGKINLDTDSWRDLSGDEHDAFFAVAGAKGSLLSELRQAVDAAIEQGQRPEEFQAAFERIAEGWDYNGDAAWRSRMIYQTNLRASYGRGREEYQLDPEVIKLQPYLQYIHSDSRAPRPNHLALDGQVFRATEIPWPLPSGYGCGCRYVSLSQRELDRAGLSVSTAKKGDTVAVNMPDGRTVNTVLQPDKGWNRTPGQAGGERRQEIIQRVIDRSPPEIAQQIRADVAAFETRRLASEIRQRGTEINERAIAWIDRRDDGQIVWLDNELGLPHILEKQQDFVNRGIAAEDIDSLIKETVFNGEVIGNQGTQRQRPIYRARFRGQTVYVAVTLSEKGFVVGANPASKRDLRRLLGDDYDA